jgi:hypothetical protein
VITDDIRTVLAERAGALEGTRPARTDEVLGRARVHRRRRAAGAVAGAGCLVLALVGGVALVTDGTGPTKDPVSPATSGPPSSGPSRAPARELTWTPDWWPTLSINHGTQNVNIRPLIASLAPKLQDIVRTSIHMDVTDDGVVFMTYDGRVWFTDGSGYEQIGELGRELIGQWNTAGVAAGTSGSLVAWVQHLADARAELVVYDTAERAEIARAPAARGCTADGADCEVRVIVADERVYWGQPAWSDERPTRLFRFDVATGQNARVSEDDLAADLASRPRALTLGTSLDSGSVVVGYDTLFLIDGNRLMPVREGRANGDPATFPTRAFETGSGRELRFRLPADSAMADETTAVRNADLGFRVFEWIDDDRLALITYAHTHPLPGKHEILVCRISTGRCAVAVPGLGADGWPLRTVPHLPYPG